MMILKYGSDHSKHKTSFKFVTHTLLKRCRSAIKIKYAFRDK